LDIFGLSLATMLETSARIAVVAAKDVRRKDRRVCMNRSRLHPAQITPRLKRRKLKSRLYPQAEAKGQSPLTSDVDHDCPDIRTVTQT
jgi:hypothetical protein